MFETHIETYFPFSTANNESTFFSKRGICGAFLSTLGEIKQSVHEPEMTAIVQWQKMHFKEMGMFSQICKAKQTLILSLKQCKVKRNKATFLQENSSILT